MDSPSPRPDVASTSTPEHVDVLVVGAGISGIAAAYHLGDKCPDHRYLILEGRTTLGGTWDLFRYPGVRSDSDMHTLGFRFRPWTQPKALASGEAILEYLHDTVAEFGIDRHIRFGHRVTGASWSTQDARWTVEAIDLARDRSVRFTCNFLFMCSGYYDYAKGYTPDFPGVEHFGGRIVHPQQWPEDFEYDGKRVVVIGSGATAVTVVPAMAERAAHVTMLQRSPTYIMSLPGEDKIAAGLRRWLPPRAAAFATRWKNIGMGQLLYTLCRRAPQRLRRMLIDGVRQQLPSGYDVDTHFTPSYAPWDQRLCFVPDGDLFKAIEQGRASVVTDHIERFTEDGLTLRSGEHLPADVVVTATGLTLQILGGASLVVDGETVQPARTMAYKAMMLSGVPNLALSFGYTNASWTLKADLTAEYVCRLLRHMKKDGRRYCVARADPEIEPAPFVALRSGYVDRARHLLPQQGNRAPWRLQQSYPIDVVALRYGPVGNDALEFG